MACEYKLNIQVLNIDNFGIRTNPCPSMLAPRAKRNNIYVEDDSM